MSPDFFLTEFRKTESCYYFFRNESSEDFVRDSRATKTLVTHSSSRYNAEVQKYATSSSTTPREDRLSVVFKHSLYKFVYGDLSEPGPAFVSLCVTFKLYTETSEQFIVSSYSLSKPQFRGVSATGSAVRIWGVDVQMDYASSSWVTVFVEWSNVGRRKGYARVRSEAGTDSTLTFTCQKLNDLQPDSVWIGTNNRSGEKALHGEIAALEIYEGLGEVSLPQGIRDLLISDQLMYYPLSRKRKAS